MTNKLKMSEYFSKMFEEFWLYFAHRKMAQHASGFLFWKTLLLSFTQKGKQQISVMNFYKKWTRLQTWGLIWTEYAKKNP